MILMTRKGCIPCSRVKEALAASPLHGSITVLTYDMGEPREAEEWRQRRDALGFTLSPVLVDGERVVAAGIMAISAALDLTI